MSQEEEDFEEEEPELFPSLDAFPKEHVPTIEDYLGPRVVKVWTDLFHDRATFFEDGYQSWYYNEKFRKQLRDPPTAIDLFCGCGGASLGMMQAGFDVIIGIDLDVDACRTYQFNLGPGGTMEKAVGFVGDGAQAIVADVRHLPLNLETLHRMNISCVWASAPCEDFSPIRKNRKDPKVRNSARNDLLWIAAVLVRLIRPESCIMENVPNVQHTWQFKACLEILRDSPTLQTKLL